mgnify:CR=1 FL=1
MLKTKSFCLSGKRPLDDIVGGNIIAGGHADQQYDALHVGDKVQLPRFGVDVAGQDVVEHYVLDEVGLVEFFVVVLLMLCRMRE